MKLTDVGRRAIVENACRFCKAPKGQRCTANPIDDAPESDLEDWPHGVHYSGSLAHARGILVDELDNPLVLAMMRSAGMFDNLD